jgi:hypothetical protein
MNSNSVRCATIAIVLGTLASSAFAAATTPTPAPVAHSRLIAVHEGHNATVGLLNESTGACLKRGEKNANVVYTSNGLLHVTGCWRHVTAAESARAHVKGDVIKVCTLPNKKTFTECSYILADEFYKPESLPPQPVPAFTK